MTSLTSAPRSKEPHRIDLERILFRRTLAHPSCALPKAQARRIEKLLRRHIYTRGFATEQTRHANDLARRHAVEVLMRARSNAGLEEPGEDAQWKALANVNAKTWSEKEEEHRGWIIAELQKRVGYQIPGAPKERGNDRSWRMERLLLHDTLNMPDRGGIPVESVKWLQRVFRRKSKLSLDTESHRRAEQAARDHGVNYIAACRRAAGIHLTLEASSIHRGHAFPNIDTKATKYELEQAGWEWLPDGASSEDEDIDPDSEGEEEHEAGEGGVSSYALKTQSIAGDEGQEPLSRADKGKAAEEERMQPEPISEKEESPSDDEGMPSESDST